MSDIHALSGAYAVDALDDIERAHFERHLRDCDTCRAEVGSCVRRGAAGRDHRRRPLRRAARPGARRHRHGPSAAARRRAADAETAAGAVPTARFLAAAAAAVVDRAGGGRLAQERRRARAAGPTRCSGPRRRASPSVPRRGHGDRRPLQVAQRGGARHQGHAARRPTATPTRCGSARRRMVPGRHHAGRVRQRGAAQRRRGHANGAGITIETAGEARRARGRRRRALRLRGLARVPATPPGRRHRLRGGRPHRGVRRVADRARSPCSRPTTGSAATPTRTWSTPRTARLAIDTGFIVHNPRTYPVLLRMFAELDVATQPSEMSMSIRDDGTGLEWAGALGRRGLFPTRANLRNPRYLAMLPRSPASTPARARPSPATRPDGRCASSSTTGRFSAYFVRHFMEPLVAAVWSCDPEVALDYPARYLFTFLQHHGMLGIFGSPQWRTVTGGSQAYVAKVAAALAATSAPAPRSRPSSRARRGRGHRRQRRGDDVRRRRRRHAPGPGAGDAGRADRAQREVLGRDAVRAQHRAPAHGHVAAAAGARRPGPAGTSCGVRAGGGCHRHLRPDPAAAARHGHPLPRDARRRGPRRPGDA